MESLEQLRKILIGGLRQNDVVTQCVRDVIELMDGDQYSELSSAVAEFVVAQQLGQDVHGSRAAALAVLDRLIADGHPSEPPTIVAGSL